MQQPVTVRPGKRRQYLSCHGHAARDGHAARFAQEPTQAHAVDVLHDDEGDAFGLPDIEDADDIGVIDRARHHGLTPEIRCMGRGLEDLERHLSGKGKLFGEIDHAHAALAEFLHDAITGDGPPFQLGRQGCP